MPKCLICKKEIVKNKNQNWVLHKKRKYCGHKCAGISIIGKKFTLEQRLKMSKSAKNRKSQPRGENHGSWKGGKRKMANNYISIWCPYHPYPDDRGYVEEHRLIMERKLKRFLKPYERVHHKNGITNDNKLENLILTDKFHHLNFHRDKKTGRIKSRI